MQFRSIRRGSLTDAVTKWLQNSSRQQRGNKPQMKKTNKNGVVLICGLLAKGISHFDTVEVRSSSLLGPTTFQQLPAQAQICGHKTETNPVTVFPSLPLPSEVTA
jgi:hypothetical protein